MDYQEDMARQELFEEKWVSREEHNALLDKYEAFKEEAKQLKTRLTALDKLIDECNSVKNAMEYSLIELRKGSELIVYATDEILDNIEKAFEGE